MSMIKSSAALRAFAARAVEAGVVAIDTEFVTRDTYYPKLGLVQLGLAQDDVVLVDPVALGDLSPLKPLVGHAGVVKVLHDPKTDLALLQSATGTVPKNIFDTQCAAGFVGLSGSISLANLVAELFGLRLSKSETWTDWLRRPLTRKQLAYAREDVRHLCEAYRVLEARIKRRDRARWLREEMVTYERADYYEPADARAAYLRIGRLGRMTGKQRAAARAVAAWREDVARHTDTPRQWVLPDKAVASLARSLPQGMRQLQRVRALPAGFLDQHGAQLIRVLRSVRELSPEDYPEPPATRPRDDAYEARVYLSMAFVRGQAMASGVDSALVASKKDIHAHVAGQGSPLRTGWRYEFAGRALDQLLRGEFGVAIDAQGLPARV